MTAILERTDDAPPLAVPGATILRQVVWLALPVLVEQLLLYLVGFSDTLLTGLYLKEDHLAAVINVSYLLWLLGSLMMVVSVGATALVAHAIGANKHDEASRTCQQAIGLAWIVGLAVLALGWGTAPAIVRGLNLEGLSAREAAVFLRIILVVTPLLASEAVGVACLRGAGDTRTGMWVMALVNAVNVALSWSLVGGLGPFPRLGFPGIAVGTACGEGLGGVIVLALLARGRSGLKLRWGGLWPDWSGTRRILRISLPAAGEGLTNGLCQLWFLGLINRLGAVATAAHGVAIRCESIAFLTVTAFAVAASTLTGQYLGAGRPDLAGRAARTAWACGVVVILAVGLAIYFQAGAMFGLFLGGGKPDVAALGVPVLRIVAFALPALATISVLCGALRGAGDTRWPWAIVLFGYLLVRLPLAYLWILPTNEGGLGWGLRGAWLAMLVDLWVRGLLVAARFLHGGWRSVRV